MENNIALNFDGYHYFYNSYDYEPNYAFFGGLVYLIKIVVWFVGERASIYIIIGLNRLLFVLNLGLLHGILACLTKTKASKLIDFGIYVYLFNPASIFFHQIYTESIYTFFSFLAIKLYL